MWIWRFPQVASLALIVFHSLLHSFANTFTHFISQGSSILLHQTKNDSQEKVIHTFSKAFNKSMLMDIGSTFEPRNEVGVTLQRNITVYQTHFPNGIEKLVHPTQFSMYIIKYKPGHLFRCVIRSVLSLFFSLFTLDLVHSETEAAVTIWLFTWFSSWFQLKWRNLPILAYRLLSSRVFSGHIGFKLWSGFIIQLSLSALGSIILLYIQRGFIQAHQSFLWNLYLRWKFVGAPSFYSIKNNSKSSDVILEAFTSKVLGAEMGGKRSFLFMGQPTFSLEAQMMWFASGPSRFSGLPANTAITRFGARGLRWWSKRSSVLPSGRKSTRFAL